MRAWSIFLFLFLFGLVSASLDSMNYFADQPIGFESGTARITEISEIQDITSEENLISFGTKTLMAGTFLLAEGLITSITVIPLFYRLGVPLQAIALCQAIQTLLIAIGVISFATGRSTKSLD